MATRRLAVWMIGLLSFAQLADVATGADRFPPAWRRHSPEKLLRVQAVAVEDISETESIADDIADEWDASEPEGHKTLFQWPVGESESAEESLDGIEPLVTDRPDFTEASTTVGRGVFQVEAGYTFVEDRDGGISVRSHSYGEPLFRYGVLDDWLELRLAVFPTAEQTTGLGTVSGVEDLYLVLSQRWILG